MKCPRCGYPLVKSFYQGKVCFKCERGHGDSITLSAIRALCGKPDFANMLWRKAVDAPDGIGAPCPECGRPMALIRLPINELTLELDICCRCQDVWFDPNELESLPKPPPPPKKYELPQKAKEALALHQIAEMEQPTAEPTSTWGYVAGLFGFPVENGAPPRERVPWCTWILAAICVAVFLFTSLDISTYAEAYGFIPAECFRQNGLTFFTAMFLHVNFWHLIGNMYFLLIFGDNVEDALGVPKYLLLTLASGIAASLMHLVFFQQSTIPCVGASGFISGIIAAYAVFFPKVTISLLFHIRWTMIWRWVAIPAWGAFLSWMIGQTFMAALTSTTASGVAYGAHLGGAIFGLVAGFFMRHRVQERIKKIKASVEQSSI